MTLTFKYTNTRQDFVAQEELLNRHSYRSARSNHYYALTFAAVLMVLAALVAYQADSIFPMCIFLTALGWQLYQSIPFSRVYRRAVEPSLASRPDTQIELTVREDGLLERMHRIESFVPWSSVRSFTRYRDTLFIALEAGLWAIIPQHSLTADSAALSDVIRVLGEKGVNETPAEGEPQ
jgi:hypothetical protein